MSKAIESRRSTKPPRGITSNEIDLTITQAADFLNVSRDRLCGLLLDRTLAHKIVRGRKYILMTDLVRYKQQVEAERHRGLDELTAEAQRLGLY